MLTSVLSVCLFLLHIITTSKMRTKSFDFNGKRHSSNNEVIIFCYFYNVVTVVTFICLRKNILGHWHGYYIQKRRRRKFLFKCKRYLGVFINKICKHLWLLFFIGSSHFQIGENGTYYESCKTLLLSVFPGHESCDARSIKHQVTIFV